MSDQSVSRVEGVANDGETTTGSRLVPEEDGDQKRTGILTRVTSDEMYRRRLVATVSVFWAFVVQGVSMAQFGPSFPDLRQIINEDLQTASWLVTSTFFGYLLGSLISGILFDKYNRILLLAISLLGMAVTTAPLPWCPYFWLMSIMRISFGIFLGGVETGANCITMSIWGDECGPYMQALHFTYSVGGILGPFITEPFLSRKVTNTMGDAPHTTNSSISDGYLNLTVDGMLRNQTDVTSGLYAINSSTTGVWGNNSSPVFVNKYPMYTESKVHVAYLIASILLLTAAVPFLLMLTQAPYRLVFKKRTRKSENRQGSKMKLKVKILCLCILSLIMLSYCSIEDNFSSYIMTFVILSQTWTKRDGSFATSLYWASFCVGRFSGIFFVRCARASVIIIIFLTTMPVSFLVLLVGATLHINSLIWLAFVCTAYTSSVIYATIFTWTEERIVPVSGKVAALLQISGATGALTTPIVLGYLMETYSPIWYVYLCLVLSISCLVFYIAILIVVRLLVPDSTSDLAIDARDKLTTGDDYKE